MCGTPRDRSPEDGPGPLEHVVGPREYFSPGPGPEKKGKRYLFFFERFRIFCEYHIFFLNFFCIPQFGPALERKKSSLCLCTFQAIWGIYYSSTRPGTLLWGPVLQSTAHMSKLIKFLYDSNIHNIIVILNFGINILIMYNNVHIILRYPYP